MLTPLVLGHAFGGALAFGMPLVFGSLLSLRYPEKRVREEAVQGDLRPGEAAALAQPSGPGSVVGPERLESLRASRARLRASSSTDFIRAA